MCRAALAWTLAAHTIPLYALYALLFVDSGVSTRRISALLAIWSAVGIVAEVPSGALADRFSRRNAVAVSTVFQACGYALWITMPTFTSFAIGFALWGIGGSLSSGSFEALVFDGLAATGNEHLYPALNGRLVSVSLLAQIPAAGSATVLFAIGGYRLVGWASVAICLVASAVAMRLPDHRDAAPCGSEDEPGYVEILRDGIEEVWSNAAVRTAVVAVALLFGLDAMEEYFSLLLEDWGVRTTWVPVVVLTIPLAGAAGSLLTRAGSRLRTSTLAVSLGAGAVLLGLAGRWGRPTGVLGLVGFYGIYRLVLSVAEARLQAAISGPSRATVTSFAALAGEIVGIITFGVWALGGLPLLAVVVLLIAIVIPRWLPGRDVRA